jgi:hypothetical protein
MPSCLRDACGMLMRELAHSEFDLRVKAVPVVVNYQQTSRFYVRECSLAIIAASLVPMVTVDEDYEDNVEIV